MPRLGIDVLAMLASGLLVGIPIAQRPVVPVMPGGSAGVLELKEERGILHAYGSGYNRSLDGGRTWLPVSRAVPGANGLVCHGDLLVSAWTSPSVAVARSIDAGTTWSLPHVLTPSAGFASRRQRVLFEVDGVLLVIWGEARGAVRDLLMNRSTDGGVTWQPQPTRLDILASDGISEDFDVASDGAVAWVVWSEVQATSRLVHYQRSSDRGATWNAMANAVPAPPGANVASGLGAAGGVITIGLAGHGQPGAFLVRSADGGASWTTTLAEPYWDAGPRDFVFTGSSIYALAPSQYHLFRLAASADGGLTWTTSGPVGGNGIYSGNLTLAAIGDTVAVVGTYWFIVSASAYPWLVSIRSTDRGLTWSYQPLAHTPPITPVSLQSRAQVLTTESGVYVASWDIWGPTYLEMIAGHLRYGTGTAGAANLEPMLRGEGVPAPGAKTTLDLTNARGGTLAALLATFAGPAAIPLGAATQWVSPPLIPFVFVTSGMTGAPGAGAASLSITIPHNPAFRGLRINSQAFLLDSAGPGGFSATAGLESWVL